MTRALLATTVLALSVTAFCRADEPETGPNLDSTTAKASYGVGQNIAGSLLRQGFNAEELGVEIDALIAGFKDALTGQPSRIPDEELRDALSKLQKEMEAKQEQLSAENRKAGEEFLAANLKKEGVKSTASGLQYQVITLGEGPKPKPTDQVKVHYRGTLISGEEFDSSYQRNEPATFGLSQVISGWTEGLQLMPVGSKYKLFVPYNLAYGPEGRPPTIPPYSPLVFEVELLSIEN